MSGDPAHRPAGEEIVLDGSSLILEAVVRIARDPRVRVACRPEALARVARNRRQIDELAAAHRTAYEGGGGPVFEYGVTTGFGEFKDIAIAPDDLERLQANILLSHAVGAGENADSEDPSNDFPAEVVRAALAIRANAFLKGHSGVRPALVEAVVAMLNRGIVPRVPLKGSVGSSGDLCPLAHLFVVLLGEGAYRVVREPGELGRATGGWRPASGLVGDLGFEPPKPSYKEGLALTNGATFSAALLALAVHDAANLAEAADVAAALALEAACGCARAFDPKVHAARGLPGQIASAAHLRRLLAGSRLVERAGGVQDPYSLRCAPAVHGASRDAIGFARGIVEAELNAATDNPLFFPGEDGTGHASDPFDWEFSGNWPEGYDGRRRYSYSAGNFHGQPVGLAADVAAIAVAELANVSERRTQLLLDRNHNRNLPANLVPHRGLNSGLMIAQYTAASLVSENKILAHPATVDSIPTAANVEDHVAMATTAARKLRTVVANAQAVLAVELLTATQAIEWRVGMDRDPRATAPPQLSMTEAQAESESFSAVTRPDRREALAAKLGRGTAAAYRAVRRRAEPVVADRLLDADLRAVRRALEDGSLVAEVECST